MVRLVFLEDSINAWTVPTSLLLSASDCRERRVAAAVASTAVRPMGVEASFGCDGGLKSRTKREKMLKLKFGSWAQWTWTGEHERLQWVCSYL